MDNLLTKDIDVIVQRAAEKAREYKSADLKTHQLRTFYGSISRMRNQTLGMSEGKYLKVKHDVTMLKPKLAYAAGRNSKNVKGFSDDMIRVVEQVKDDITLENFFALVESVVAYHKYYGGGE